MELSGLKLKRIDAIILLLAGAALTSGIFLFWDFTVDDAFITFRYAEQLARGNGITWNQAEHPVEGYTNFLWLIFVFCGLKVGLAPTLLTKLLGAACLCGVCVTLFVSITRETGSRIGGLASLASVILFSPFYVHAAAGLETVLYAWLLLLNVISARKILMHQDRAEFWKLPVLGLLAGLTRPEGVAVALVCLLWALLSVASADRRALALRVLCFMVLPGIAYMSWRLWHYGWLLPNTYYIKFGHIKAGIAWLAGVMPLVIPVIALFLACPWGVRRFGQTASSAIVQRESMSSRLLLTVAIMASIVPYAMSNLMMDFARRFLCHMYPMLALAFGLAIAEIGAVKPGLPLYVFGLSPLLFLAWFGAKGIHEPLYGYRLANAHIALGKSLRDLDVPPALKAVAIGDAGAVPYLSRWTAIDFVGLNDETIAHGKSPTERVEQADPALIVLFSKDGRTPRENQYGLSSSWVLERYVFAASMAWSKQHYLLVYVSKKIDEKEREVIANAIAPVALRAQARNQSDEGGVWETLIGCRFVAHQAPRICSTEE